MRLHTTTGARTVRWVADRCTAPSPFAHLAFAFACALLAFATPTASAAGPVEFGFRVTAAESDPFAREIWADVVTPSGATVRLPAFYRGNGEFAVRARATEAGEYRLGAITEGGSSGAPMRLDAAPIGDGVARADVAASMAQVRVGEEASPTTFVLADGASFQPVGSNLAWTVGEPPVPYFRRAMHAWQREDLNWMRIWMAHWGRLNLDWLDERAGPSPAPGTIDESVANSWDAIVADAEAAGVYIQLVLQHHGQYSTRVNSNWGINPWNAANPGGFLKKPGDFFTDPKAIALTKRKYRYIVARWGYSPAIMAWELFNEVHWVDPIHIDRDETTVAAWHSTMAAALRGFDSYGHLVTTSTEDMQSAIYRDMDYFQPHLYPSNILAAVRSFHPAPEELGRPVFYGEVGDDHVALSEAQKKSGVSIVPPVWASLMGTGRYAAQPWLGWDILAQDRVGELGAVARFANATQIGTRDGLVPFSSVVESDTKVPLVLAAGQAWRHHPEPDFELPLDGRMPVELADVPRNYVTRASHKRDGFPSRGSYTIDAPQHLAMRATVTAVGANGGSLRISADGRSLAGRSWKPGARFPDEVAFTVPAGRQTLVVENSSDTDWVEVLKIDLGVETSALAAIGRRGDDFIACWIWNREGVFAVDDAPAVAGTLVLDEIPAGEWRVEWWDTFAGKPTGSAKLAHTGGTLRLPTPPIARHATVVLEREGRAAQALAPATTSMKPSETPSLFAPENLLAWCIVPFDIPDRTPAARIAMLKRLGFTQYVWDWRAQHLPSLPEEIRLAREAGVRIRSAWLWIDAQTDSAGALSEGNRAVFAAFEEARMPVEFWVGMHVNYFEGLDDAARVAKGAAIIAHLRDLASRSGSTVALYNHGDWFGEPDNQLRIIEAVGDPTVGIVYNFHHGHTHIDDFPGFLPRILPRLRAVNLNGMNPDGPKILPIGSGTRERGMIGLLIASGYRGPIGILGHVDDVDIEPVLAANLAGLRRLVDSLD